ncbi:MAG TPA: rRNA pseudouridine synthase [Pseudomonadales bacterium]|nr:rRNA pseudouridine synthase [Pseudomonadales bacterium]
MPEPVRLSKRLTELFECSRREAELAIEGGWVMVDGVVVEEPQFKVLDQEITLHPDTTAEPVAPVTILLHKPAGYDAGEGSKPARELIHADSHATDDVSHNRILKKHFLRLQAVLPLETAACGLQVYSQDPRIIRKLTEDACKMEQEFIVEVSGTIARNGLALLNHGLSFEGKPLPAIKVSWQNETRLRVAVKEPKPGQIAHMCSSVGLGVVNMKRIRIGRRPMGNLQSGQWRYLPDYEKF